MILWKSKGFWCITYLCSVVVWSVFGKNRNFSPCFALMSALFQKIFPIKWHGWLAYLLWKSHAMFQRCSFKGKKLWYFYWFQSYQVKILVCIFNEFREEIGVNYWFSGWEHIKIWYFENVKDFLMLKIPLLSSCMKRFRQKIVIFRYFLLTSTLFQKIFFHIVASNRLLAYLLRRSHVKFQTCSFKGPWWYFYQF